jgi:hypothetical protein
MDRADVNSSFALSSSSRGNLSIEPSERLAGPTERSKDVALPFETRIPYRIGPSQQISHKPAATASPMRPSKFVDAAWMSC